MTSGYIAKDDINKGSDNKLKFINSCKCEVDYDTLEKAIIFECENRNITPNKQYKIYLHQEYATITLKQDKIPIHRLIGGYMINMSLPSTLCTHHIDEDKLNDYAYNLQVMTIKMHNLLHNEKRRSKRSERRMNIKKAHKANVRKDVTLTSVKKLRDKGFTYKEIQEKLGCGYNTVWRRIREIEDVERRKEKNKQNRIYKNKEDDIIG